VGREPPSALLIDLDGVLRTWDPEVNAAAEERYGLPPGALLKTAMDWPLLRPAITGEIDHAEWMERVAVALGAQTGDPAAARAAVKEWQAYRGMVDADVLGFIRDVRAAGLPVGLTTNATDRLDADLAALGLAGEVDAVINSSELGVPKPAREYFAAACAVIGAPASSVLFVDDSDRCVRGARVAGLSAYRWNGPDDLRYLRSAFALARSPATG
jgi:putative hydrolase of the HAD superfamily